MSTNYFPIDTFEDIEGNPLSNGYVIISLSKDCRTSSNTQLCAGLGVKILLDSNGSMVGSPLFWPNSSLLPIGSTYILNAFSSDGDLVFGPVNVLVVNGTLQFFGTAFGSNFGS